MKSEENRGMERRDMLGETPHIAPIKNMLFTTLKADFLIVLPVASHLKETSQEKGGGKVSTAHKQNFNRKTQQKKHNKDMRPRSIDSDLVIRALCLS